MSDVISKRIAVPKDDSRTGMSADALTRGINDHLRYTLGRPAKLLEPKHYYQALSLAVRDRLQDRWLKSTQTYLETSSKVACYLSAEFLLGPHLGNNLLNLGLEEEARTALSELGQDFDEVLACEEEPGLGNGGLGRLAACYLDSLATLARPAIGYGIRYEFGIFDQDIRDGWQVEKTDYWLADPNPWEIVKTDLDYIVGWGGHTERYTDEHGHERVRWVPERSVKGVYYGTPIQGYGVNNCNTLALWSARAIRSLALDAFNAGDYYRAVEEEVESETVTKVLYPNDEPEAGKQLRLLQQHFFVSCSLQDILHLMADLAGADVRTLPERAAVQLNDTHPSIAVAELMRLLVDERELDWDEAWRITVETLAYTNHTLLPEALESWPLPLFERLLPRHMQIVYAINSRVLREARKRGMDDGEVAAISLIDEGGERRVRMANLAFSGAHSVNGVAALHTELMKTTVFSSLHKLYPGKINNKTNGVTPRRWLQQCNPALTATIRDAIGDAFLDDAEQLAALDALAGDAVLGERIAEVKRANKVALAAHLKELTGIRLNPDALFDVQIKRIHEYKRQLLNLVETVALYDQIRSHPERDWVPRVKIFGGKAASSYHNAKLIIKLANDIARRVNSDPSVGGLLKVVFVPNYNVSLAERIIPAADLSEQISTAGMEASGTGNMKFALNGALTIGTLDGANIEIKERVGDENIVIFGLTADEVAERRANGYDPRAVIEGSRELHQAVQAIASGVFSPDDPHRYTGLMDGLYNSDWFMLAADFDSYAEAQRDVDRRWLDQPGWRKSALHNIANVGWFSSDRTIAEYARDIWKVQG